MISLATGLDMVEIERFHHLNPKIKQRFLERVFTPAERDELKESLQSMAGKFAAKEAASKALGCGIGRVKWQDLELLDNADGKPELVLHAAAAEIANSAGWSCWSVSISHTRQFAVAMVTALIDPSQNGNGLR